MSTSGPYYRLSLDGPLLSDTRGRGIRIAVLDSGVNQKNPHVGRITGGFGIGPTGREREDFLDTLGHGTAVLAAIQEKAPEAEIIVVKVFHEDLSTTLPGLMGALERVRESGVRLVNLSLGSARPDHEAALAELVARLCEEGALLVSPCEHRGRRWWPGSLPGVVGVLLDWECPRQEIRMVETPGGRPLFRASGYPRPVAGIPRERNLSGISFAAANVTGLIARLLEGREEIDSLEPLARAVGTLDNVSH